MLRLDGEPLSQDERPIRMARCLAAAFAFSLIVPCATGASGGQADRQAPAPGVASDASQPATNSSTTSAPDSASLDRIRAGLERPALLANERVESYMPTFRTEVIQNVIELRDRWSLRDPDATPPPFAYPIPSAGELLINAVILKPRAALSARKQRAIRKQIQSEIRQIEQQQRDAAAPPASPTPKP
jgi:hypothetical protein